MNFNNIFDLMYKCTHLISVFPSYFKFNPFDPYRPVEYVPYQVIKDYAILDV